MSSYVLYIFLMSFYVLISLYMSFKCPYMSLYILSLYVLIYSYISLCHLCLNLSFYVLILMSLYLFILFYFSIWYLLVSYIYLYVKSTWFGFQTIYPIPNKEWPKSQCKLANGRSTGGGWLRAVDNKTVAADPQQL